MGNREEEHADKHQHQRALVVEDVAREPPELSEIYPVLLAHLKFFGPSVVRFFRFIFQALSLEPFFFAWLR
jgi:hypothetical protein